jgi:hypothetical protein
MKTLKWIKIGCELRSASRYLWPYTGNICNFRFHKGEDFPCQLRNDSFSKTKPLTALLCAIHNYNNMYIIISGVNTTFEKRTSYFIDAELSKPEFTRTSVTSIFTFIMLYK